jgi:hypothetical protein
MQKTIATKKYHFVVLFSVISTGLFYYIFFVGHIILCIYVKKLQKQIHNVLKLHKIKNGPGAGAIDKVFPLLQEDRDIKDIIF